MRSKWAVIIESEAKYFKSIYWGDQVTRGAETVIDSLHGFCE